MSSSNPPSLPVTVKIFRVGLCIALGLAIITAIAGAGTRTDVFDKASNDDVMRLMSVRDLIAGQGWFDMVQYRVAPPEGVSLHWSRYIDAGIAGMISLFSVVLSPEQAEYSALIGWPLILLLILVVVVASGTRALFGAGPAAIAAIAVVAYPPLVSDYFGSARLDHHNVQILLMTIAVLTLARADKVKRMGVVSGTAAALSLAIGLEMLIVVGVISILHVTDVAMGRRDGRSRLVAFCTSLILGSTLLFVGQTPVSEWALELCDELGLPILSLAAVGAFSCLTGLAVPFGRKSGFAFLSIVGVLTCFGLFLGWPLIGQCVQPPYANLSEETRLFISERILEARPLVDFLKLFPSSLMRDIGPAVVVLIGSTLVWAKSRKREATPTGIGYLLVIGWLGLLLCFWQIRQIVIVATVVPALTGYFVSPALQRRLDAPSRESQLSLYGVVAISLGLPALGPVADKIYDISKPAMSENLAQGEAEDGVCANFQSLSMLNELPAARVLSGMNLGPILILSTHHSALAAPYHRSARAMENGFWASNLDVSKVLEIVESNGADFLIVCSESRYGKEDSIGSQMARGESIEGLERVPLGAETVVVYQPARNK